MSIQQPSYSTRETSQCGDEIYEQRCPLPCGNSTISENDLRAEWSHEARNFTPFLLQNSNLLSDVVGMPIQLEEREVPVGPFFADLMGIVRPLNWRVIIENQLNQTDHDHLGKLITYAADKDAKVNIWVSPKIRIEHRRALEWLNNNMTNKYFFGIEIELFQIEGSLPHSVKQAVRPEEVQSNLFPIEDSSLDNTSEMGQLILFSIFSQIEDTARLIQISEFPQKVLKLNVVVAPKAIALPSKPSQTTRQPISCQTRRSQHYAAPSKSLQFVRQSRKPRQYYQKTNSRRNSRLGVLPYILGGVGVIFSLAMLWHSPHARNPKLNME